MNSKFFLFFAISLFVSKAFLERQEIICVLQSEPETQVKIQTKAGTVVLSMDYLAEFTGKWAPTKFQLLFRPSILDSVELTVKQLKNLEEIKKG